MNSTVLSTAGNRRAPPARIDADAIHRALAIYLAPSQVTELRALNCTIDGERRSGTFSGYFDREHVDDLVAACERIEAASGIYFAPNPVDPRLLARSANRARIVRDREPTTSDRDIRRRRWLLIDVDPVRPAGIGSSGDEKQAAWEVILNIDCELWRRGFPAGIIADSGNGWHLSIPIDLAADDDGIVQRLLAGLAAEFDSAAAKVDVSVFNPARIWKLPGTWSCKGDNTTDRPHRIARIVQVCNEVEK